MKKLAAMAVIPLFGAFLCAQESQSTTTTTKTTTWNGTLVDAGCQTTHTDKKETRSNPDSVTTKTEHTESTDCPVTSSTSSFGLMTDDGKFVRFDQPSNTKIIQVVKSNNDWSRDMSERKPIHVRVIGTPHGDVVVMESIH